MIKETETTKSKCLLEKSGSHIRVFEIKIVVAVAVNARGRSALKNLSALQYISQVELKKAVESAGRATWIDCTSERLKIVSND